MSRDCQGMLLAESLGPLVVELLELIVDVG